MRYQDTTEGMRFDVTQIELPLSAARLSACSGDDLNM